MRLLALLFTLTTCASTATATVIHVLPDGSGDVPTIAEALAIAVFGDVISLGDGIFYEHDLPLKTGVSITSDSGDPSRTTIDAELSGRCLTGASVTGAPSFTGVTLQNGVHAAEGGLMLAGHNNVRFYDCVFRNGSAPRGGAVSLPGPSHGHAPSVYRCRFESSESTSDGGAIWSLGVGYLENCEFIDNVAQANGGAVFCQKSSGWGIWLRTCRFEQNAAGGDGGAVYSTGGGGIYGTWITSGEFIENSASRGGAAWLDTFDFAAASRFLHNHASEAGGALYLVDIQVDKEFDYFAGNLLAGNSAGSRGGAIAVTGESFLTLHFSTVSGNEALNGANLWSDTSGLWGDLYRTIIAFGVNGAAVAGRGPLAASCSDVYGNAEGDYAGPLAGVEMVNGNFSSDPLFCNPDADDFTLREGSPCFSPLPEGCGAGAIGAYGIGCSGPASVPDPPNDGGVSARSWGRIKSDFRD